MTLPASPLGGASVLFDLDGTIINSRTGIIATIHLVLRDMGHDPDPEHDLNWVVGPPLRDLIGEILRYYDDTRCDEAMERYRQLYETTGKLQTPVFEGMREVLDTLRAAGATLYIATSKPKALARSILERHGLVERFREIYGAQPDDSGAEKPELIASALRDHKIETHHAVMIGDRRFDISGAHANNIRAIGVAWGYSGAGEMLEAAPEAIAATPDQLPMLVTAQFHAAMRHVHATQA